MHQKYFVPFQLNLPDVKSSALEGDKHTAVQVLYCYFSLITIIYNILLVCVSEQAQLHGRNYGLRFFVMCIYSQFLDAERGIRSCLIGELC